MNSYREVTKCVKIGAVREGDEVRGAAGAAIAASKAGNRD